MFECFECWSNLYNPNLYVEVSYKFLSQTQSQFIRHIRSSITSEYQSTHNKLNTLIVPHVIRIKPLATYSILKISKIICLWYSFSEIRAFEMKFENNRHFISTLICHGQFVKTRIKKSNHLFFFQLLRNILSLPVTTPTHPSNLVITIANMCNLAEHFAFTTQKVLCY